MYLVSNWNPRLFFIRIKISLGDPAAHKGNFAHKFLDDLEVDSFAARAVQVIPTLKIAELMVTTTHTRVFHWTFEGAAYTCVPSVVETEFSPVLDDLIAAMLQGEFPELLLAGRGLCRC